MSVFVFHVRKIFHVLVAECLIFQKELGCTSTIAQSLESAQFLFLFFQNKSIIEFYIVQSQHKFFCPILTQLGCTVSVVLCLSVALM